MRVRSKRKWRNIIIRMDAPIMLTRFWNKLSKQQESYILFKKPNDVNLNNN